MRVHQLLSGAGPHDAVTTETLALRRHFRAWGWGGADHAYRIHPALDAPIRPAAALSPDAEDVVLIHHSAGWPQLDAVLGLAGHKLLRYHNVTPAAWFWAWAPGLGAHCQVGRDQLRALVAEAAATTAVSGFNASELRQFGARAPEVIALLMDEQQLGVGDRAPRNDADLAAGTGAGAAPNVLFVGRLSPHKRQDEVIRTVGLYRRVHAAGATLTLVGGPINPPYLAHLRDLAQRHAPGAVSIVSGLSDLELAARYRAADVFLCLSEHEGFCVPLIEAFSHGVPVIARPFGAIPEVCAGAALLVPDPDPAVIAEMVQLVVTDADLRAELVRRGYARLGAYGSEQVLGQMREAIERVAA